MCCSALQSVTVCCRVSQCAAVCYSVRYVCVAVCCSVLQCAAVCCSVRCRSSSTRPLEVSPYMCCSVLQCAAVCCSVLKCKVQELHLHVNVKTLRMRCSMCCSMCCSVLQSVSVCCSVRWRSSSTRPWEDLMYLWHCVALCFSFVAVCVAVCFCVFHKAQQELASKLCCSVLQCIAQTETKTGYFFSKGEK